MKYLLSFFLILISVESNAKSVPYINIGFSLSFGLASKVMWAPKICVGMTDEGDRFINLTGSYTFTQISKDHFNIYSELGLRTQWQKDPDERLFYGIGVGVTLLEKDSNTAIDYRVNAFTGLACFLDYTWRFSKELPSTPAIELVSNLYPSL